jgi:pectate lyase
VTYADLSFSSSTLTSGNVTLNATGTATGTVGITGTGTTRTVTISSITGDGTLGISIAAGTATDAANNAAPSAGPSATFTVDNTAPATTVATASFSADTGASATDFITNTAAQTISGTLSANVSAGETVQISLDNGATWTTATTSVGANTWSHVTTLAASDTLRVRVSDTAGNNGAAFTQAYVLDTVAPGPATGFDATPAGQNITLNWINPSSNFSSATIRRSTTASPATITDGTSVGAGLTGTTLDDNALSEGTYYYALFVLDLAGNSSASVTTSATVDTVAPAAPTAFTATPSHDAIALTWINPVSDFASNTLRRSTSSFPLTITDGSSVGSGLTGTSLNDTGLADGTYYYAIFARDTAGNTSAAATTSATVDTAAPAAPVIVSISDDTGDSNTDQLTSDTTLSLSGTAEPNSTVTLYRNTASIGVTNTDSSGDWTFDYTATALAAGTHTFTATATDASTNVSLESATFLVEIDAATPIAPVITGIGNDTGASTTDGITSDTTLNLSGTAEANATVTVSRSTVGVIGTAIANSSGDWEFNYSGTTLADGSYLFTAFATDSAGNVSTVSADFAVTIDTAAPVIGTQPVGATYVSGDSFTLTVGATDATALSYQWSLDATALSNSANRTGVATPSITHTDIGVVGFNGDYAVEITDLAGNTTTSTLAAVVVNKADQTITFPVIADQLATAAPFALTATTSTGFAVTFSVISGPATLSGNTVTLTGAGTVTLRASQAGDVNYNPATLDRTFTVTKAVATVTFGSLSQTYTGSVRNATATTAPAGLTVNITYDGGATAPINAGSYAVVGTIDDALYQGSASGTLVVAKAAAPIVLANLAQTYNGSARTATATTTPAGLIVAITYEGVATAPTNAGSYAVDAAVVESNYTGAASGILVVAKADQTVAFDPVGAVTVGTPVTLSATATSGLPVTFSVASGNATVAGASFTANDANMITLRATQPGNSNYNAASTDQIVTNITRLAQTIAFTAPADRSRTAAAFALTATATSTLPVSFTVESGPATIAGNTITLTGLPGTVVLVAHQAGDDVYAAAADVSRSFAVTADYPAPVADGFAKTVTGGSGTGSQAVTATTAAELRTAAESSSPSIITVIGVLNLGSTPVAVKSDKTIQGADANATLIGNLTLSSGISNVIVRGLNVSNPGTTFVSGAYTDGGSGITIAGATRVFITHCSFFDCGDHALTITNGADNVTVSWSEFYYTAGQTGHRYSVQIGNATGETAPLHVSMHHNRWHTGVDQRMPSATYGYVHLYNNVYVSPGNTSGTEASDQAQFLSERNAYTGVANPLIRTSANTALPIGRILALGNTYTDTTGTAPYAGLDAVFTPGYSYEMLPTSDVLAAITASAGNISGAASIDPTIGSATITGPAAALVAGDALTLTAVPSGVTAVSFQWRLNNLDVAGATSATYTVASAQETHAGTYTVAIGLATGDGVVSQPFTVTVNPAPVTPPAPPAPTGGGGGGAVSPWFLGLLFLVSAGRVYQQRRSAPTIP